MLHYQTSMNLNTICLEVKVVYICISVLKLEMLQFSYD